MSGRAKIVRITNHFRCTVVILTLTTSLLSGCKWLTSTVSTSSATSGEYFVQASNLFDASPKAPSTGLSSIRIDYNAATNTIDMDYQDDFGYLHMINPSDIAETPISLTTVCCDSALEVVDITVSQTQIELELSRLIDGGTWNNASVVLPRAPSTFFFSCNTSTMCPWE